MPNLRCNYSRAQRRKSRNQSSCSRGFELKPKNSFSTFLEFIFSSKNFYGFLGLRKSFWFSQLKRSRSYRGFELILFFLRTNIFMCKNFSDVKNPRTKVRGVLGFLSMSRNSISWALSRINNSWSHQDLNLLSHKLK